MLGIVVLLGLLAFYLFLTPARLRKFTWFNLLIATATLIFIIVYQHTVSDSLQRIGLDMANLKQASRLWLIVTPVAFLIMLLIGLLRKTIVWSWNILICLFPYVIWGGVQQYITLGFVNVRLMEIGLPTLVVATVSALLFACLHLFDKRLFPLTLILGFVFSMSFQAVPNLLPLAVTHGVLGVAFYYFIAGEDAWKTKLIEPLKRKKT